ncbi:MAG: hypothetical protein OEV49_03640 [candidate division Zixibacteria bacterium]|nr:hypothetical protein [candidate division Zixibacteria bacterium]MDH3939185.1 hypothetical protein [candidate division Zixibacteria bacterium]MDH4034542.1 hypothetical protein [candidate division Zixibacteria bacterium]
MKKNCWELKACGREPGGSKATEMGICTAATDRTSDGLNGGKNGGRFCWAVAGTLCGGVVQGSFAEKKASCLSCEVFKQIRTEEGREFVMVQPGQRVGSHK